jgi:hypothetical protein
VKFWTSMPGLSRWPPASFSVPGWPDALTVMGFIAGATTRIRVNSGVIILPLHNPVRLAKGGSGPWLSKPSDLPWFLAEARRCEGFEAREHALATGRGRSRSTVNTWNGQQPRSCRRSVILLYDLDNSSTVAK